MRTLVAFHSMTGNTRKVGQLLASALNADVAEIVCPAYRRGPFGALRQAWDIFTGASPVIEVASSPGDYDLVVAGGPVWAGRPAPPLRSFVVRYLRDQRVVLFLTCNGTSERFPPERALRELTTLLPGPPVASRLFRESLIASSDIEKDVRDFAETITVPR